MKAMDERRSSRKRGTTEAPSPCSDIELTCIGSPLASRYTSADLSS